MTIDNLLRSISKLQNFNEIIPLINEMDPKEMSLQDKVQLLILRALTDKGFKSVASMLGQECMGSEDLDGNGLIYGLDFHIIDSDDKPFMLKHIPNKGVGYPWKGYYDNYIKE